MPYRTEGYPLGVGRPRRGTETRIPERGGGTAAAAFHPLLLCSRTFLPGISATLNFLLAIEDNNWPVVVFTSGNYMEAQFIASVLNGNDIAAFVLDDNTCRMYPWGAMLIGGAKVLVSAENVEQANDVLAGVEEGESPMSGKFLSIPLSEPAALITFFRDWLKAHRD